MFGIPYTNMYNGTYKNMSKNRQMKLYIFV